MPNCNLQIEQFNRKRLRILTEIEGYQELIQFKEIKSKQIENRIEQLIDQYNDITKRLQLKIYKTLEKLPDDRIV